MSAARRVTVRVQAACTQAKKDIAALAIACAAMAFCLIASRDTAFIGLAPIGLDDGLLRELDKRHAALPEEQTE